MNVAVVIPAFNEEESISKVVNDIPRNLVADIIVVNNNSTDNTEIVAKKSGALVLLEKIHGYGASCLKGIEYLKQKNPDVIVFLDGDYSDYPGEIELLLDPFKNDDYDFVIGSRITGKMEDGSMPVHSRLGNILSCFFINLFWKTRYTDLGPFRAIKFNKLLQLNMNDPWYGWTVEMQIKAAKQKLKIKEVPVSYRKRIGRSKVSGTLKGSFMAGTIILKTIFVQLFKD